MSRSWEEIQADIASRKAGGGPTMAALPTRSWEEIQADIASRKAGIPQPSLASSAVGYVEHPLETAAKTFNYVMDPAEEKPATGIVQSFFPQTEAQAAKRKAATGVLNWLKPAARGMIWKALEGISAPWNAMTRGDTLAVQAANALATGDPSQVQSLKDVKAGFGETGKALLDTAAIAGAGLGGADAAGRIAAIVDARKETPESYRAAGMMGFGGDLWFDPLNPVKIHAKTPKWNLHEAVLRSGPKHGFTVDKEFGNLVKTIGTGEGAKQYTAKISELTDAIAAEARASGITDKASVGRIRELQNAARMAEKSGEALTFEDLSRANLSELAKEGYLANRFPFFGTNARATSKIGDILGTSKALKQSKILTLGYEGEKTSIQRARNAEAQAMFKSVPGWHDLEKAASKEPGGLAKLEEDFRKQVEADKEQVLEYASAPMSPENALAEKSRLIKRIDFGPSPINEAAEKYNALTDKWIAGEQAKGVPVSGLQRRFSDVVETRIREAGQAKGLEGDALESFMEKSRMELHNLQGEYDSPGLFKAARGIERHPIFAPTTTEVGQQLASAPVHGLTDLTLTARETALARAEESIWKKAEEKHAAVNPDQPLDREAVGMSLPLVNPKRVKVTSEDLHDAYRRLAKELHPDTSGLPSAMATEDFNNLTEAYRRMTEARPKDIAAPATRKIFAGSPAETLESVFHPDSPSGYYHRMVPPEYRAKIDKLLRTGAIKEGDPSLAIMQNIAYGRSGGTAMSGKPGFAQTRSTAGGAKTTSQMLDMADEFMSITAKEGDQLKGLLNHPDKKVRKLAEELHGNFFEVDPYKTLEKRGAKGAAAMAAQDVARAIADDPILSKPIPGGHDSAPFTREGLLGGSTVIPLKTAENRDYMTMSEVVPGVKGFEDVAIHPEAGEYLKAMHRNLSLSATVDGPLRKAGSFFFGHVRRVMLSLPITAGRNLVDSDYKNFVTYGAETIPASGVALAALDSIRPELSALPVVEQVGKKAAFVQAAKSEYKVLADGFGDLAERFSGHPVVNAVGEVLTPKSLGREMLQGGVVGGVGNRYGFEKTKVISGFTMRASNVAEDHARATAYIIERWRGHDEIESALRAYGVHWKSSLHDDLPARIISRFGGGKVPSYVAGGYDLWSRYGASFWFFTRNNYPFWMKAIVKHPGRANFPAKALALNLQKQGSIPPEMQSERMSVSPYVTGMERGQHGPAVKYLDVSAMSQFQPMGDNDLESTILPVWGAAMGAKDLWDTRNAPGGPSLEDPYFGQKLKGVEAGKYIAQKIEPALGWLDRPLHAIPAVDKALEGIGLRSHYPEKEGLGTALAQRFAMFAKNRKENVGRLEKEGLAPYLEAISDREWEMKNPHTPEERRKLAEEIGQLKIDMGRLKAGFWKSINTIRKSDADSR